MTNWTLKANNLDHLVEMDQRPVSKFLSIWMTMKPFRVRRPFDVCLCLREVLDGGREKREKVRDLFKGSETSLPSL